MKLLSLVLPVFLAASSQVQTWSTTAWTGDATTGIASKSTAWAAHFGTGTNATVDGVTVDGYASGPVSNSNFDLTGPTSVLNNDTNSLTALGGNGSALMAKDFVYDGNPATVLVKNLELGQLYTLSFFSVDWDGATFVRQANFGTGISNFTADQGEFGTDNGIRVDCRFTATATTQTFTITPTNPATTWHLYGLALQRPLIVRSNGDAGPGSLRQALADAAAAAGPHTITFSSTLSGSTINLASQLAVTDAGGVTVDASALPAGITVSGGNVTRCFSVASGKNLALRGLTLTGGNSTSGGGAIQNQGTLSLTNCTLSDNTDSTGGGAIFNSGNLTLTNCTVAGNTAYRGGGILSSGTLTMTHCTVAGNLATGPAFDGGGGGIETAGFFSSASLTNTILANNTTAAAGPGPDYWANGVGGPTLDRGLVGNTADSNITPSAGNLLNVSAQLSPLSSNGGPNKTMVPLFGSPAIDAGLAVAGLTLDQRGYSRVADGDGNGSALPDMGAVEIRRVVVTTLADENDTPAGAQVSLREALRDGDSQIFAPALSGGTITLGSEIVIPSGTSVDVRPPLASITISGSLFTRLFNVEGLLKFQGLTLSAGNAGTAKGGAIRLSATGSCSLVGCTLAGNRAEFGGAISNDGGALELIHCTLYDNTAAGAGAINNAGIMNLTHCTLAGNNAYSNGSVYGGGAIFNFATATLSNTLITGNTTGSGIGPDLRNTNMLSATSCLIGNSSNSGVTNGVNGNITDVDARLGMATNNGGPTKTILPRPGSPVIDAASLIPGSATDQRGFPRVADGDNNSTALPDIGAVEFPKPTVVTTMDDQLDTPTGAQTSLREAVRDGASYIIFSSGMSGASSGVLNAIDLNPGPVGIVIDASSLPGGYGLVGGTKRIFTVGGLNRVTLRGIAFYNAQPASGPGGAIASTGDLTVEDCWFRTNRASFGGAISNSGGTLTATNCTFNENQATDSGGAISNVGAMNLTHCTFVDNSSSSSLAGAGGGAIAHYGGVATLVNTLMTDNTAVTNRGPDFLLDAGSISSSHCFLKNGNNSGVTSGTNGNLTGVPALLGTSERNGGPYRTFLPLPGSPMLDAGVVIPGITTDQRGFARVRDGDGNSSALPDIGAVEVRRGYVTTLADENDTPAGTSVSLREAVLRDTDLPHPITFAPGLNGGTILLNFVIQTNGLGGVNINASSLPAGISLSGRNVNSIFATGGTQPLTLTGLSLVNGNSGFGGAIQATSCDVILNRCLFKGNGANSGESYGGAILVQGGSLTASNCTFINNTASTGGALWIDAPMTLTHCTIVNNQATGASSGGGVYSQASGVTMTNCIFSGNSTINGISMDLHLPGGTPTVTNCLILGGSMGGPINGTNNTIGVPAQLGPLANNGGPTQTMLPLPGSPVIDAGIVIPGQSTDQRGFPRVGDGNGTALPDMGAVEVRRPVVNTLADQLDTPTGAQTSLREALRDGADAPNPITFAPALNGGTITLASTLQVDTTAVVDATALTAGLTLTEVDHERVLVNRPPADLTLKGITFWNPGAGNFGSIILNQNYPGDVTLTLHRCIISGNTGLGASPIYNEGTLKITESTFSNNVVTGSSGFGGGGVINNHAALFVTDSTFSGNTTENTAGNPQNGGAIYSPNNGSLTLTRCTFSGNTAVGNPNFTGTGGNGGYGGAIYTGSNAVITQCTFSNNTAGTGGAIFRASAASAFNVTQSTFSGNQAIGLLPTAGGGAVASTYAPNALNFTHCLIAGNTAASGNGPDIFLAAGTLTATRCLIGNAANSTIATANGNITGVNALLAPLGNYGGLTQTMALLPGSPARNAIPAPFALFAADQRGFLRVGNPDMGAYEAGTYTNYNAWIYELLPASATVPQHASTFDYDNDGQTNGAEFLVLSDPATPNGAPPASFQATIARSAGNFIITFPSTSGKTYTLWTSTTLAPLNSWLDTGMPTIAGDGSTKTFTFSVPADPKRFYRVQSN